MLVKVLKDDVSVIDLPVGTKFHVINGNWDGEIVLSNGNKCVRNEKGVYTIQPNTNYNLNIHIHENSYELCEDLLQTVEHTPIPTEGLFTWEDDDVPF
ncbi:hypothetical protein [Paraclostridium bifermentans]|uniref:hypothetical protein n=1 Tax=Paraclostridium bifermentans TaxID=1490 RepID=UPI00374F0834